MRPLRPAGEAVSQSPVKPMSNLDAAVKRLRADVERTGYGNANEIALVLAALAEVTKERDSAEDLLAEWREQIDALGAERVVDVAAARDVATARADRYEQSLKLSQQVLATVRDRAALYRQRLERLVKPRTPFGHGETRLKLGTKCLCDWCTAYEALAAEHDTKEDS